VNEACEAPSMADVHMHSGSETLTVENRTFDMALLLEVLQENNVLRQGPVRVNITCTITCEQQFWGIRSRSLMGSDFEGDAKELLDIS